jgi:ADP-dependent NAD(P)H-hydrate dehydratase / NAD(P)H-hydrate epimerase
MPGMRGAGRLCANAALRGGAGLVTLASTGEPTADDAVMTAVLDTQLGGLLDGKGAVAIGPGLGQSAQAASWLRDVLASGIPAVLDADALNLVASDPALVDAVASAGGPIVLTPHPAEAARLLGTTSAGVEADRLSAARALASRTRAVVVLKGARTLVCDGTIGDEFCAINSTGGPELATAGSGDVLTGLVASLLAQGVSPVDAARTGIFIHGRAGERLAAQYGSRGVVSSDLPVAIAGVLREITG